MTRNVEFNSKTKSNSYKWKHKDTIEELEEYYGNMIRNSNFIRLPSYIQARHMSGKSITPEGEEKQHVMSMHTCITPIFKGKGNVLECKKTTLTGALGSFPHGMKLENDW